MKYGVIDIETTGLDHHTGEILEVCIRDLQQETRIYNRFYHTTLPDEQTADAIAVNHLTPLKIEKLRGGYPNGEPYVRYFKNDINFWQQRVDEFDVLIAHNAPFDISWLNSNGVKTDKCFIMCTQKMMQTLQRTKNGRISLKTSVAAFGIPYDSHEAHGAEYDTWLTGELFKAISYQRAVNYMKKVEEANDR